MTEPTRVLVFHPTDQTQPKVGGIHSFIDAFIAYAPDDFQIEHIGVGVGGTGPVAEWTDAVAGDRPYRFLRALAIDDAERRGRIPLGARFALALARLRDHVSTEGRVLQFHRPGLALPYLRSGAGRVQVIHLSSSQLLSADSESRWRALPRGLRFVENRVLPRMDAVYAISEEVTDAYRARYPRLARRISFVSNWVDQRWFRPLDSGERGAARRELEAELGAEPGGVLLLAAGRLDRQKRPLLAVEALAALDIPDAYLGLVGAGPLGSDVLRHAAALGVGNRVRILPPRHRAALARTFGAADVLVIASAHETGPTVAFEALAVGLPVASTPVGRVPALLSGSDAGALAAGDDPRALATAVRSVLSSAEATRRGAAIERAAEYRAPAILAPLYDRHRELAARV